MLMGIGVFFVVILSMILLFYGNNFISRRRQKELGLYMVLGLEKRQIGTINTIENIYSATISYIFAIIGGHLFAKLAFMFLNSILSTGATSMDYNFSLNSAVLVLLNILVVFFLIELYGKITLARKNVVQVLKSGEIAEREPKTKVLLLILGTVFLVMGYTIALKTDGTVLAIANLFQAILLVMAATYFLYISLSIFILKRLKAKKKYYYKKENFLNISEMLYRMKANAVSLSSIAILSTGVILALTCTISIYRIMEN